MNETKEHKTLPIERLPDNLIRYVFQLAVKEKPSTYASISRVNKRWHQISRNKSLRGYTRIMQYMSKTERDFDYLLPPIKNSLATIFKDMRNEPVNEQIALLKNVISSQRPSETAYLANPVLKDATERFQQLYEDIHDYLEKSSFHALKYQDKNDSVLKASIKRSDYRIQVRMMKLFVIRFSRYLFSLATLNIQEREMEKLSKFTTIYKNLQFHQQAKEKARNLSDYIGISALTSLISCIEIGAMSGGIEVITIGGIISGFGFSLSCIFNGLEHYHNRKIRRYNSDLLAIKNDRAYYSLLPPTNFTNSRKLPEDNFNSLIYENSYRDSKQEPLSETKEKKDNKSTPSKEKNRQSIFHPQQETPKSDKSSPALEEHIIDMEPNPSDQPTDPLLTR